MHLQVRTDNHVENSEELADSVRSDVEATISSRYGERVRRVEVYFQDVNSGKKGGLDIRCAIEASLAGHQPVAVDAHAPALDLALEGALIKLTRALDHTLDRLDDRNERVSMSGEPT